MFLPIFATTGISLLLYVTGFFVLFIPLTFAFTALRKGFLPAALSFLFSLVLLGILYRLPSPPVAILPMASLSGRLGVGKVFALSLINFFFYGWLGLTLAFQARRSCSLEKGILTVLVSGLLLPGVLLAAFSKGTGFHPVDEFRGGLQALMSQMIDLQQKSGLEGDELFFLKQHGPAIVSRIMGILPALGVILTLLIASLNILFLRRWVAAERPFPGWIDFSLWRIREKSIWIPIVGGSVFFLNHYMLHLAVLTTLLLNLLLVMAAIYFYQGLSIVSFYFRKRLPPMVRILSYFLILLFVQVVGVIIVTLGLFDFWFDFRKLKTVA